MMEETVFYLNEDVLNSKPIEEIHPDSSIIVIPENLIEKEN